MRVVAIIAARLASTRFPRKPLATIAGVPMIGHVFHRSTMAAGIDDVWIATCDREILDYANSSGAKAVMTSDTHERATDRIAEAMGHIEKETGTPVDVALLVQADEPMLVPTMLDELALSMRGGDARVSNLMSPIDDDAEFEDANTVKVVCDAAGDALYFSREPIPSRRKFAGTLPRYKQLGLIAFRRDTLLQYALLSPTPLEKIESVDMNRLLEHGIKIRMVETVHRTIAVDTFGDFQRVEAVLRDDPLVAAYPAPQ